MNPVRGPAGERSPPSRVVVRMKYRFFLKTAYALLFPFAPTNLRNGRFVAAPLRRPASRRAGFESTRAKAREKTAFLPDGEGVGERRIREISRPVGVKLAFHGPARGELIRRDN
ncbi:hypothetical protein PUN28_014302 [Cardiocondyla obscurior]|uniref:Uncharacterized protein n=1 Tax=Cardiocondyla obscurior TaxID=286306 RepID=A0AAW2EZD2_9HYME